MSLILQSIYNKHAGVQTAVHLCMFECLFPFSLHSGFHDGFEKGQDTKEIDCRSATQACVTRPRCDHLPGFSHHCQQDCFLTNTVPSMHLAHQMDSREFQDFLETLLWDSNGDRFFILLLSNYIKDLILHTPPYYIRI